MALIPKLDMNTILGLILIILIPILLFIPLGISHMMAMIVAYVIILLIGIKLIFM